MRWYQQFQSYVYLHRNMEGKKVYIMNMYTNSTYQ